MQELNYEDVVTEPGAREFVIRFKAEIARQTRVFLDKMLMELFNDGKPIRDLAKVFRRTNGAIIARIKRLGWEEGY